MNALNDVFYFYLDVDADKSRTPIATTDELPIVLSERFKRSPTVKFIDTSYRKPQKGSNNNTKNASGESNGGADKANGNKNQIANELEDAVASIKSKKLKARVLKKDPSIISSNSQQESAQNNSGNNNATGGAVSNATGATGVTILPAINAKGRPSKLTRASSTNSVGHDAHDAEEVKPTEKTIKEEEGADFDVIGSYMPFPLGAKSGFNMAKLTEKQIKCMDPLTKAKYLAYEKPEENIVAKICQSDARSRIWLRSQHRRTKLCVDATKKKWELLHRAIEDPAKKQEGEQYAAMARKRMHEKIRKMMDARVSHFYYSGY